MLSLASVAKPKEEKSNVCILHILREYFICFHFLSSKIIVYLELKFLRNFYIDYQINYLVNSQYLLDQNLVNFYQFLSSFIENNRLVEWKPKQANLRKVWHLRELYKNPMLWRTGYTSLQHLKDQ
ncbi:unnamed protein product [Ceratitis capitata]|uniref:(Mediterranean fruit fly) hypothetical protein n=1 Tax=Ceratitis capitata TaxID=7213 RepID=A0A811UJL3_CERCA|nr:unnamed protein product [Ceratitis capitata]